MKWRTEAVWAEVVCVTCTYLPLGGMIIEARLGCVGTDALSVVNIDDELKVGRCLSAKLDKSV